MKRWFLLFSLLLFSLSGRADGQKDFEQLFKFFQAASKFDHSYPREKVYLHLDNNSYVEGETLWFEAYVMRASTLTPTTLSRVLYVELLNTDGQIVARKQLRVENGRATGEFDLELPVSAGFYEVRAYTREMINWGAATCCSRVVPVFAKTAATGGETPLTLERPEQASDLAPSHPRPFKFTAEKDVSLSLFPEGGSRVAGLSQQVAFRLTDGHGHGLDETCRLYDDKDRLVAEFRPLHDGMGLFTVPDDVVSGYVAVGSGRETKRFPLPEALSSGYVMTTTPGNDGTSVVVARSGGEKPALLGLSVTCREQVCYFDTLTVTDAPVELLIPETALRSGVNRIVLYDVAGRSRAERLVFKRDTARTLVPVVLQNAETYAPFAPVALDVRLNGTDGRPVATSLSVSVREAEGLLTNDPQTAMNAELLLFSELRGYVDRPEFYFERDDAAHRRALDLLLMVQGWTSGPFEVMNGTVPFALTQPIEDRLTLDGRILEDNDKRRPRVGATVRLSMYSHAGAALISEAVTDSTGGFAFVSEEDYVGPWIGQFTIEENGKKRRSRVVLNRWFDPEPRSLDFRELEIEQPSATRAAHIPNREELFEWEDTFSTAGHIVLPKADVVNREGYKGFTGNRYSYNGGERAGLARATHFYNISREMERWKDEGRETPLVWNLLKRLDDKFDYAVETELSDPYTIGFFQALGDTGQARDVFYIPYYRGRPAVLFVDNTLQQFFKRMDPSVIFADEINTAVIIEEPAVWQRFVAGVFTPQGGHALDTYRPAAIFLYSNPDFKLLREKKGIEKRLIEGFAKPRRFYAPDYRGVDLPSATDRRRTLYWNPDLQTDAEGHAGVVFFNNARDAQRLTISVRGLTKEGEWVSLDR